MFITPLIPEILSLRSGQALRKGFTRRLPRFPFAMLGASARRNDTGMKKGRARTQEVTVSCRKTGCFLYQSLRQEQRQREAQKDYSSCEETKAHAASGFSTLVGDKEACAKYNKEQAKHDGRCSPKSETSTCIQSTDEEKDEAQPDTDLAVSFGHRAEFSTPKTRRQSQKHAVERAVR